MTDDRHDPGALDDLGELLSLADQPVHFPDPARGELLDQVIRTASMPRAEATTVVPTSIGDRATSPARRTWIVGVAASLLLIVTVALALVARGDGRPDAPADRVIPAPMTIEEVCDALPPLAAANGLGQGSVQIAEVSLDELEYQRRLIARLSADQGGAADAELVADAITRIRLMEISIEASDTSAAALAMTAARASVSAVIDEAC